MTGGWLTYNDKILEEITAESVCQQRQNTAHLLFCEKRIRINQVNIVHQKNLVKEMGENWRRQKRGREIPVFLNLCPVFTCFWCINDSYMKKEKQLRSVTGKVL